MKNDILRANILSARLITNVAPGLAKEFGLNETQKSIGIFTSDNDDIGTIAMDDATKKASVQVIYGGSMYAGAANANTKLAGEFTGILAGPDISEVKAGMDAVFDFFTGGAGAYFVSCNEDDSILYLACTVSRIGTYFAKEYNIAEGSSIVYCIAPPLESIYAVDAALKAANVEMTVFWKPPTNTNFSGAIFTGAQSDCVAAGKAYGQAVQEVADLHIRLT